MSDNFKGGEERLIENNNKHPQRQQGGLKGQELVQHNNRMGQFNKVCREKRGFYTKAFADTDLLIEGVDSYLETVSKIGLFPTLTGLALYLDVSIDVIRASESLNDERSHIFQKFRTYISEYFNQNGLASNSNPVFSIYYGKSVLGQTDQPQQMNVNVNFGNQQRLEPDEIVNEIKSTPDEFIPVDFEEVE